MFSYFKTTKHVQDNKHKSGLSKPEDDHVMVETCCSNVTTVSWCNNIRCSITIYTGRSCVQSNGLFN